MLTINYCRYLKCYINSYTSKDYIYTSICNKRTYVYATECKWYTISFDNLLIHRRPCHLCARSFFIMIAAGLVVHWDHAENYIQHWDFQNAKYIWSSSNDYKMSRSFPLTISLFSARLSVVLFLSGCIACFACDGWNVV